MSERAPSPRRRSLRTIRATHRSRAACWPFCPSPIPRPIVPRNCGPSLNASILDAISDDQIWVLGLRQLRTGRILQLVLRQARVIGWLQAELGCLTLPHERGGLGRNARAEHIREELLGQLQLQLCLL